MSINTLIGKEREKYDESCDDAADDSRKRIFFEEKILPHYRGLYYYSFKILKDKAAAEDVVQTTLERAWKRLDRLRDPEHVKSWVFTIARNEMRTMLRRRRIRIELEFSDEMVPEIEFHAVQQDILEALVKDEEHKNIGEAVSRLPEKYCVLIGLRYYWDFSEKDIAKITGLKYSTVRVYIHRALKMLLDIYNEIDKEHNDSEV